MRDLLAELIIYVDDGLSSELMFIGAKLPFDVVEGKHDGNGKFNCFVSRDRQRG